MANHEKFQALSLPERWIANGKMQHAYANSPKFFEKLNKLIEQAEKDGVYADVKFLPHEPPDGEELADRANG